MSNMKSWLLGSYFPNPRWWWSLRVTTTKAALLFSGALTSFWEESGTSIGCSEAATNSESDSMVTLGDRWRFGRNSFLRWYDAATSISCLNDLDPEVSEPSPIWESGWSPAEIEDAGLVKGGVFTGAYSLSSEAESDGGTYGTIVREFASACMVRIGLETTYVNSSDSGLEHVRDDGLCWTRPRKPEKITLIVNEGIFTGDGEERIFGSFWEVIAK